MRESEVCMHCQEKLVLMEISNDGTAILICMRCKLCYCDEQTDPGVYAICFSGKKTKKDTFEYYETEITFLKTYIDHLSSIRGTKISHGACHHNISLALVLKSYLHDAQERLERLKRGFKETY